MTITDEELRDMTRFATATGTVDDVLSDLAAEVIRLRAKVAAGEKLAEAVSVLDYEARTSLESAALAAWKAAQ